MTLLKHAGSSTTIHWVKEAQTGTLGFYEQKQLLTLRRQDNKYYKQVHSQVLQDVVLRLDKAYQAFLLY
jgi:putative transposase